MAESSKQSPGGNSDSGLKSSQPAPMTAPTGVGTPIGPREPSTKNDK